MSIDIEPDQVVHQWGEMTVTSQHVHTPTGVYELVGTRWSCEEQWQTFSKRPAWAMVLGLFTFWTVIGALFFFVTTTEHKGSVAITMQSPTGAWWKTTVQANQPQERQQLRNDVMWLDNWSVQHSTS